MNKNNRPPPSSSSSNPHPAQQQPPASGRQQAGLKMTKAPTPAETRAAQEAWRAKWSEEVAARQQKEVDAALAVEWQADEHLVEIDAGRGVLALLPGMAVEQLHALGHALHGSVVAQPMSYWIEPVRRRREARRVPPMPAEYLADHVRLQRRLAFVERLKAKRRAAEAEASKRKPPAAPKRKPTLPKKRKPTLRKGPLAP